MSALLYLPDDICLTLLSFCTCAARHGLEATCRRMRQLLQLPGAWLELGVHNRVAVSQRVAVEAVHAVRTETVLRALVDKLMHRNDAEHPWGAHRFDNEPLAGRDHNRHQREHPKLFENLCHACRRGSATTIAPLRTLDQLVLVVEVRHFSDKASGLPDRSWAWVVQPSADDRRINHTIGQMNVADIDIAANEVDALPFDDNTFVVVWAVHRASKAVALLHAAAPEGSEGQGGEHAPGIHPAGETVSGGWSAASLLPRWHPQVCYNEVTDPSEHGGESAHRDSLTLSAALDMRPAWVRASSAATDRLVDPRDVPGEVLPGGALPDALREEIGADFAATAWRPRILEITLQVEGFTNAAGRPTNTTHPDLPYIQPERFLGESKSDHSLRCVRNMIASNAPLREACTSFVRGAVVAQLATNTLWMAPRAYRHKNAPMTEAEEDVWYQTAGNWQLYEGRGGWQLAVELRHRVNVMLEHAAYYDSEDNNNEDDEDEEEDNDKNEG